MLPRGLESVTVTPGITAPDASVTVPPIAPTPCAIAGRSGHAHSANTTVSLTKRLTVIVIFLSSGRFRRNYSIAREHTPPRPARRDSFTVLWQRECEHRVARRDRDVLTSVDREGHGGSVIDAPKCAARSMSPGRRVSFEASTTRCR